MAYLLKGLDGSLPFGSLDYNVWTYLIVLNDSLKKIEQLEGYDKKGVLDERVKSELIYANTIAKHLGNIFGMAGTEIAEEYAKNYKFLRGRLEVFNHLYNPSLTTSK